MSAEEMEVNLGSKLVNGSTVLEIADLFMRLAQTLSCYSVCPPVLSSGVRNSCVLKWRMKTQHLNSKPLLLECIIES